jgi:hypothetical protein
MKSQHRHAWLCWDFIPAYASIATSARLQMKALIYGSSGKNKLQIVDHSRIDDIVERVLEPISHSDCRAKSITRLRPDGERTVKRCRF